MTSQDKEFFKQYRRLKGSITVFEEYERHLNIFFLLTRQSYIDGEGISKADAFNAWVCYCDVAGLAGNEADLFFDSVDQVHSYS